ncbi:hypothetical protein [Bacteriovorax sp. Seq25_V]|uniref:hypothetical protein n=1 Tax=Bacteriovorax sp. Seq25_V TaxID=1201288 RepID=UPI000389E4AE|nr:hypothetical protein [Bacteriovorax sp. Seq25_V]EQC47685.1 hypothetical protein M900_A0226 [Bacteriovorax sp. Seq25_V]
MKKELQVSLEQLTKYRSLIDTESLFDGESLYVNKGLDNKISIYSTDGSELMLFENAAEFELHVGVEFESIGDYQLVYHQSEEGQQISLLPVMISPNFARLDS